MLIRQSPYDSKIGPMLKEFDAKMKIMADFDHSTNKFFKISLVSTYFPVHFSTCEENQKGCSSDDPF